MELRLKIENNMSKAEEGEILSKLAAAFNKHGDNYLTGLFSNRCVAWLEHQMRDDSYCDFVEHFLGLEEENRKLERRTLEAEHTAQSMQGSLQKERESFQTELVQAQANQDRLLKVITDYKGQTESLLEERSSLIQERSEFVSRIDKLDDEILRLKARLYDALLADK